MWKVSSALRLSIKGGNNAAATLTQHKGQEDKVDHSADQENAWQLLFMF